MAQATAGFSVADLISSLEFSGMDAQARDTNVSAAYDKIKSVQETEANNQKAKAADEFIVENAKQAGQLKVQAENAAAKTALGTDMSSAAAILATLGPQIQADFKAIQDMDAAIDAKESVSFFDNPLEYIGNQLSVDEDYNKRNALARNANNKAQFIKTVNDLTQEQVQTNLATLESTSATAAAAASRNAATGALTAANRATIEAAGSDINKIEALRVSSQQQLSNRMQGRQLLDAEADRAMRVKDFNASQAERAIRLAEFKRKADDDKALDTDKKTFLTILNAGRTTLKQSTFATKGDADAYFKTKEGNDSFQKIYDVGYQAINTPQGKDVIIDVSPGKAADLLIRTRGTLTPAHRKVQTFITETLAGVANGSIKVQGLDTTKKDAVLLQSDTVIDTAARTQMKDVTKNKTENIYASPSLQALITAAPQLAKNKFINNVLGPEIQNTVARELDPQYTLERAAAAISSKEIKYNEAVEGLKLLFLTSVEFNNATRGYARVGLPEQVGYNARIKTDPNAVYFSGDKTLNLTTNADISSALNKMLLSQQQLTAAGKSFDAVGQQLQTPAMPATPAQQ